MKTIKNILGGIIVVLFFIALGAIGGTIESTYTMTGEIVSVHDEDIIVIDEKGEEWEFYGTGYSNVKRVTTLPVDIVKLDRSFIEGVDDEQMWIMIRDTIKMLFQQWHIKKRR